MGKKVYDEMFKQQLVKEAIETGNASLVGRKHGVSPKVVNYWVRNSKNPSAKNDFKKNIVENIDGINQSPQELRQALKQVDQLKSLLGERELEIAILRDLFKKTNTPLPQRLT